MELMRELRLKRSYYPYGWSSNACWWCRWCEIFRWCRKMEKKLAVIVDNKEITTEVTNTEMCSSACDVAMETCSSECHDTCGMRNIIAGKYKG